VWFASPRVLRCQAEARESRPQREKMEGAAAPPRWQLECLRSRKAGEELDGLAERIGSLPEGAERAG